jgi:hypothetical protein
MYPALETTGFVLAAVSYVFIIASCVSVIGCVGILEGCQARGEKVVFVALPRDKWIGANM